MKIAIFTESFLPLKTGVAKFSYELALNLSRRGHEVDVLTGDFNFHTDAFNIVRIGKVSRIYANGSFTWFIRENPFKLKKFLRKDYDVLHNQGPLGPPMSMLSPWIAKRKAIPTVGTFHSKRLKLTSFSKLLFKPLSYLVKKHDILTAPSQSTAKEMHELFGVEARVVPNAIDTDVFHPNLPKVEELMDGKLNILFVGRFDERKGVDVLLSAWRMVSGELDDARLVMVGSGPMRELVVEHMKELGNIKLYEDIPMGDPLLPRIYATCDFCVFPSKGGEAFGIVILEAFACGKTAILSDIEGYNEVACKDCAIFVPPNDPSKLAQSILILARNEELRRKLSREALRKAQLFSWKNIVVKFEEIYASVKEKSTYP